MNSFILILYSKRIKNATNLVFTRFVAFFIQALSYRLFPCFTGLQFAFFRGFPCLKLHIFHGWQNFQYLLSTPNADKKSPRRAAFSCRCLFCWLSPFRLVLRQIPRMDLLPVCLLIIRQILFVPRAFFLLSLLCFVEVCQIVFIEV